MSDTKALIKYVNDRLNEGPNITFGKPTVFDLVEALEQAESRAEKAESDKAVLEEDLEATEKNLKESSGFIEELLSGLKHRFPVQYADLEGDEYGDDAFSSHDLFEFVIDPAVNAAQKAEAEVARLEALVAHYESVVTLDNVSIPHQIIKSVPALVTEVRSLREKIEEWEWLFEVIEYDVYEDHPLSSKWSYGMSGKEREAYVNARVSYSHIEDAAREAVHADRG